MNHKVEETQNAQRRKVSPRPYLGYELVSAVGVFGDPGRPRRLAGALATLDGRLAGLVALQLRLVALVALAAVLHPQPPGKKGKAGRR